jgi:hypothetical protein
VRDADEDEGRCDADVAVEVSTPGMKVAITPGVYDGTTPGVDIGTTPGVKARVWTMLSATLIDAASELVAAGTGMFGLLTDATTAEDVTTDGALLATGTGTT